MDAEAAAVGKAIFPFPCTVSDCVRGFDTAIGLGQHLRVTHGLVAEQSGPNPKGKRKARATHPESAARRRQIQQGLRPHIDAATRARYFDARGRLALSIRRAATHAGISESSAKILERENKNNPATLANRDPVPYAKLSEDALRMIQPDGFNEFRAREFGRRMVPWAGMAARELLALYESPTVEFVDVNCPPGVGKSTMITHDFIAWLICRERALGQEPTVLLGHRTHPMAKRYVRRLAHSFTFNVQLLRDFGRFRPNLANVPWSQEELLVEPLAWENLSEKDPTVSAASQELGFLGGRHSVNVWDDLVDKVNSRTEEAREMLRQMWETEMETRPQTGGLLVLSGARYGPEDLHHTVLSQWADDFTPEGELKKQYVHIRFKAHYEEKCLGGTHHQEDGSELPPYPDSCLLDPSEAKNSGGLPWSTLRKHSNKPRFSLVWQQEDSNPTGSLAVKEWFTGDRDGRGFEYPGCFDHERSFGELPERHDARMPLASICHVDPSDVKYWAISHTLIYPGPLFVVVQTWNNPLKTPDFLYQEPNGKYTGVLEDFWNHSAKLGVPFNWLIYEENLQRSPLQYPFFVQWRQAKGITLVHHRTNPYMRTDDDMGVPLTGPVYREGRVRLPYKLPEDKIIADQWQREACAFPEGTRDDLPMHFWFLLHHLPPILAAEQASEQEDEDDTGGAPDWARVEVPEWANERLAAIA